MSWMRHPRPVTGQANEKHNSVRSDINKSKVITRGLQSNHYLAYVVFSLTMKQFSPVNKLVKNHQERAESVIEQVSFKTTITRLGRWDAHRAKSNSSPLSNVFDQRRNGTRLACEYLIVTDMVFYFRKSQRNRYYQVQSGRPVYKNL